MSGTNAPDIDFYIGIDYSGAQTPTSSLKGLRVYMAERDAPPFEVQPPPSPRKYWTRRGIAEWPAFLDDFQCYWPTDQDHTYVDFIRDGAHGNGAARSGNSRWRRLTDKRAGAKSVFHFDVPGSVAKSTHAGLPWLRYLRQKVGNRIHFWPFNGWEIPAGRSIIAEAYPSLFSREFHCEGRTTDQHDAYSVAAWMRRSDLNGSLAVFFKPYLTPVERAQSQVEG